MDSKSTSNIFKHRQIVVSNIYFYIVKTSCQVVKKYGMAGTPYIELSLRSLDSRNRSAFNTLVNEVPKECCKWNNILTNACIL